MKHTQLILFVAFIAFFTVCGETLCAQDKIIPAPQQITFNKGHFKIDSRTKIVCSDPAMQAEAEKLKTYIAQLTGKTITVVREDKTRKNVICMTVVDGGGEEAYRLNIRTNRIECIASSAAGMFYAGQSLLQLMSDAGETPCADIFDEPRFSWRGLMLDVSRHFFEKEVVMQQFDIMARLKMNRYHLHLTDEPGWRIEIKRYPKLTETGADGNWDDRNAPRRFYTQDDIREIVEYARRRHIMVIPEIDMPGHASAASRAYPEISAGGTGRWAGFTFHPAKDESYEFIENILKEIAGLFPAPYIHIGGDEVHYGNQVWHTDSVIQQFIKTNNLKNEVALEHYFVNRVAGTVRRLGKTLIGWDEIVDASVPPEQSVVMWWRHDKKGQLKKALDAGYRVILTPRLPCYFDFVQHETHKTGRRWGKDFNPVDTSYLFPDNLPQETFEKSGLIQGIQANIWTERIADKKRLDFMTFPRLAVIAEDAWTNRERKNSESFTGRLKFFLKYLDKYGIYYFNPFDADATPEPWGPDKADVLSEG
jgi:hexosaminidase